MKMTEQIPLVVVAALAVLLVSAVPVAAQDDPPQVEKRMMIWRTEDDQAIGLEAIHGQRGFLGVGLLDLTPELRAHFGVPTDRGIMISAIVAGSPAERAGLLPADILTAADGEPLPTSVDLSIRVARAPDGAEVELERWREGRRDRLRVPVEIRPRSQLDLSPLVVRRIEIKPGHRIEVETGGDVGANHRWIEEVVETVGDSFSEATFVQQLEALRRERTGLLEKLQEMETRLGELENEIQRLDSEDR